MPEWLSWSGGSVGNVGQVDLLVQVGLLVHVVQVVQVVNVVQVVRVAWAVKCGPGDEVCQCIWFTWSKQSDYRENLRCHACD